MADSENQQAISQTDTTQQVTSQKQKNPNRVHAGKAIAAKTKMAREAQNLAIQMAIRLLAQDEVDVTKQLVNIIQQFSN